MGLLYHPSSGFEITYMRAQAAAIAVKMIDKNRGMQVDLKAPCPLV
jgi:hypothetical protein